MNQLFVLLLCAKPALFPRVLAALLPVEFGLSGTDRLVEPKLLCNCRWHRRSVSDSNNNRL